MYNRITCCRANKGKMYTDSTYTSIPIDKKVNDSWLTKKNGSNCGIYFYLQFYLGFKYIEQHLGYMLIIQILINCIAIILNIRVCNT